MPSLPAHFGKELSVFTVELFFTVEGFAMGPLLIGLWQLIHVPFISDQNEDKLSLQIMSFLTYQNVPLFIKDFSNKHLIGQSDITIHFWVLKLTIAI